MRMSWPQKPSCKTTRPPPDPEPVRMSRTGKGCWPALFRISHGLACHNITRDNRVHLVSSNRECFAHYKHISYFFSTNILCPCMYTPGDSWGASGPKPCGGNNVFSSNICFQNWNSLKYLLILILKTIVTCLFSWLFGCGKKRQHDLVPPLQLGNYVHENKSAATRHTDTCTFK